MEFPSVLIERLISPAIMISATGLLLLSVNQRTGRIADRLRQILDHLREVDEGSARYESLIRQLTSLRDRGRLTQRSVMAFLCSVLMFVLTAGGMVVEFIGGLTRYIPVISFYLGLLALLIGLLYYLWEIRESFRISRIELDYWLDESGEG